MARLMRGRKGLGKSRTFRAGGYGGIKPLNAPRVVYVRTDSAGTPVAVQVPPAITSARGRHLTGYSRGARDPHPSPLPPRERGLSTSPPSLPGRELEGGSKLNQIRPSTTRKAHEFSGNAASLLSDGRWVKVTRVDDLWKVNDEWWRGPEEEIARLYYMIRLENSQQLTVYLDLITNNWYRQAG